MSDSLPPKKHSAEWWGLLFSLLVTWSGMVASYVVLRERVDTLTETQIDHEHRLREAERDKALDEIGRRLVRVETLLEELKRRP